MTMPTRAGVSMAIHATARRVVGDPPGAVRMTRGHVRTLLVRFDAPAFYSLARKYACYRGTSSRGLQPGKGDGYGTEFVFLGSGDTMRVIVVDPRTTCVCTLPILSFLSRGIAYWDTYPCGWATSRSRSSTWNLSLARFVAESLLLKSEAGAKGFGKNTTLRSSPHFSRLVQLGSYDPFLILRIFDDNRTRSRTPGMHRTPKGPLQ